MDCVRGALGRATAGVLQRPDRPEHEGSVDTSGGVVDDVARPGVCGAGGRCLRDRRDRSVLQRRGEGLEGSGAAAPESGDDTSCNRRDSLAGRVRRRSRDVASSGAATDRSATDVGADPFGISPDVRSALETLSRDRIDPDSGGLRDHPVAVVAVPRNRRAHGHDGPGRGDVCLPRARDRTTLTLLGLGLVQAAVRVCARRNRRGPLDRSVGAYRIALRRLRPLLRSLALFVIAWVALTATAILIPVAIWLAVRWCLLAPAIELESHTAVGALRRSGRLVRRRWIRVGSLVGVSAFLALAAGPLLGWL